MSAAEERKALADTFKSTFSRDDVKSSLCWSLVCSLISTTISFHVPERKNRDTVSSVGVFQGKSHGITHDGGDGIPVFRSDMKRNGRRYQRTYQAPTK